MKLIKITGHECIPDDVGYRICKTVREVATEIKDSIEHFIFLKQYTKAVECFLEAGKSSADSLRTLRHEPYVTINVNEDNRYVFIFKCDNNGNTYRITE